MCGGDNRGIDLPAPLQQPEDDFGVGPTPAMFLAGLAEITLVGLDFPRQSLARYFACDELAQLEGDPGHRVAMDPNDLRGRSCCGPGNEQLQEDTLLMRS